MGHRHLIYLRPNLNISKSNHLILKSPNKKNSSKIDRILTNGKSDSCSNLSGNRNPFLSLSREKVSNLSEPRKLDFASAEDAKLSNSGCNTFFIMVNAIRGLFISCDIPMAQFIINLNNAQPQAHKFIIQVLDNTHLFVKPDMAGHIRTAIAEFREQITYEKPA